MVSANQEKKRLLLMGPLPPPYMGPTVATETLLNSRLNDEFDIEHLDTSDHRPLTNLGRIDFRNVYLALEHYVQLFWKLAANRGDVVYIPISQTAIGFLRDVPFVVLSKLFRKKVVLHLRGGYFREFYDSSGDIMRYIIRKTLKKVDRMIVLGNALKKMFNGLVPKEKLSVVPNGVDIDFGGVETYNAGKTGVKVLFLSNFIRTKGFWDVLLSVKEVIKHHDNIQYVFAGSWVDEGERVKCEEFLRNEQLSDYVEFMGTVTGREKMELFADADIFVFPTFYHAEGHPWAIVEAMAAGLPIISTAQGAITESVVDGENGFIVEKQNPGQVAEKIIALADNPALCKRMGEESRRLYLENFTGDKMAERLSEAFKATMID
jgi:glycosyltransferase involved in cell wall biosynthesis